eukprot:gene2305-2344_t
MIAYARASDSADIIEVFTNGSKLTPEINSGLISAGLQRINISLEGLTDERYYQVAGVRQNFQEIIDGVRDLYEQKQRANSDLKIYVKIADQAHALKKESTEIFLLSEQERKYFLDTFSPICDEIFIEKVVPQWAETQLDKQNEVSDRGIKVVIGNVSEQSVSEIWTGALLKELQVAMIAGKRKCVNFCGSCSAPMVCVEENLDPHLDKVIRSISAQKEMGDLASNRWLKTVDQVINFQSVEHYDVLAPTRHELNLLDDAACTDYLGAHLPEFVIHCAVDITSVEKTLAMFFNIYNQKASFGQLITLGSGAEYDKRCYTPNMTEERLGISVPIDTYGLAKYLIAREIENGRNSNVLNLRVFGIFVNRDMLFNYIYVDDLAKAIALILPKLPLHSKSYNFCRSASDSLLDIAELIHRKLSVESEVIVRTPGRNPEYSGCPDKYFKEVGHVQFEPMDVSIDKLIKYYTQCMGSGELKALREKWNIEDHDVPRGSMSLETFKEVFDKILADAPSISHISLYSWGEPLIHPHVAEIVEYVHAKNNFLNASLSEIASAKSKVELCTKCTSLKLPEYNMGYNRAEWLKLAQSKTLNDVGSKDGLVDDLFYFVGRLTPYVNVDLLIRHPEHGVLMTWRDDEHSGKGWHSLKRILTIWSNLHTHVWLKNRADKTQQTLEALKRAKTVDQCNLLVVQQIGSEEVTKLVNDISWIETTHHLTQYPECTSVKYRINSNVRKGLESAFAEPACEYALILEDDILLGFDFLHFCNVMHERYRDDPKFKGINAFSKEGYSESLLWSYGQFRYGVGKGWSISRKQWEAVQKYWIPGVDQHFDYLIEEWTREGFVVMPYCSRSLDIGWGEGSSHGPKDEFDEHWVAMRKSWRLRAIQKQFQSVVQPLPTQSEEHLEKDP